MPRGTQEPPTPFARSIHAEINGWMKRRGLSQRQLAENTGISQGMLSKTIGTNRQPLDANDIDLICTVLDIEPADLILAASRALKLSDSPHTVDSPDTDLALAAKKREARNHDAHEEDYF